MVLKRAPSQVPGPTLFSLKRCAQEAHSALTPGATTITVSPFLIPSNVSAFLPSQSDIEQVLFRNMWRSQWVVRSTEYVILAGTRKNGEDALACMVAATWDVKVRSSYPSSEVPQCHLCLQIMLAGWLG